MLLAMIILMTISMMMMTVMMMRNLKLNTGRTGGSDATSCNRHRQDLIPDHDIGHYHHNFHHHLFLDDSSDDLDHNHCHQNHLAMARSLVCDRLYDHGHHSYRHPQHHPLDHSDYHPHLYHHFDHLPDLDLPGNDKKPPM